MVRLQQKMSEEILKIICSNGGVMYYERLIELVSGFPHLSSEFDSLIGNKELFFSTVTNGVKQILAKTNVRICKVCDCTNCTNLHLCKFYLHGECRTRRCRYGHDLNSGHNAKVLADHHLQKLSRVEIRQLLLQNDSPHSLLPPLCASYNRGDGDFGQCDDKDNCTRLHICEDYIRGTCDFRDCGRSHDFFEPHPMKTLRGRGVPVEMVGSMLSVYQRILMLRGTLARDANPKTGARTRGRGGKTGKEVATANSRPNSDVTKDESRLAQPEINEICLFFVKVDCKQGNKCWRVHSKMPYLWQRKSEESWTDLPNNEDIERDFCNPINTTSLSGGDPVCFDTMTCGVQEVRRLSTASSVAQPSFILTTEWQWYWENEYGTWILYGSIKEKHGMASISSIDLEKRYQDDSKAVVQFAAGKQQYELSFTDMMQKNVNYGTPRRVRRRPNFISSNGVQTARFSKRKGPVLSHGRGVPGYWDKTAVPEKGYKKVALQDTDRDYLKVQELFRKTLSGYDIVRVERIQNKELWEDFQTKRERMKRDNQDKKYGDGERLLFHGTKSEFIDNICYHNFDWRKCGANGTVYGEGCYFARDARYSHAYTSGYGERSMFVCRVLVGSYTRGQSHYRLPPSRDGGHILYDSCVNDGRDPSIFVVFDKQQVYPEFLITYTEHIYHPPVNLVDSFSDSDDLFSFVNIDVTSSQFDSAKKSSAHTTLASTPTTVNVSSSTPTSPVFPPAVVPSASGGLRSTGVTSGQNVFSSGGTVSVQLPSSLSLAPNLAASRRVSATTATSSVPKPNLYSHSSKSSDLDPISSTVNPLFQSSASTSSNQPSVSSQTAQTSKRVVHSDPKPASSQYLYSSSDASLTSSNVRSATRSSVHTGRVSPPRLSSTTPLYTRPVTRPQSQEDLYYVPRSAARPTYQPKKKEECILL